jgi:hypothetical protein
MYFQINESIPATYLFIIYYPPWNHSIVEPKVNTLLLSSVPLFLDTPHLITSYPFYTF